MKPFLRPFLLLDKWRTSPTAAAWVKTKIFLKEGMLFGNWHDVWKDRSVGGSVSIPRELAAGLQEMDVPFHHNDFSIRAPIDTAVVFKDPRCLDWALSAKRCGKIRKLFAGPFVTTLPDEARGAMLDPAIDGLLFFSEWHRDLFTRLAGGRTPARHVWFAGVDTETWKPTDHEQSRILIYDKSRNPELLASIYTELLHRGLETETLTYGRYSPKQFHEALGRARLAIFLSRSETQGVAMFEAWSSGVPTLHWNPGIMRYLGRDYDGASSCAYLSPLAGRDFRNLEEFPERLDEVLADLPNLNPRAHVLNGYTRRHSVERFLMITAGAAT